MSVFRLYDYFRISYVTSIQYLKKAMEIIKTFYESLSEEVKTALLFGVSWLVGSHVLDQLISNNSYSKIKLFVRTTINISDPKIEIIQTDFKNLENHREDIKGDDCFFCIGTTKQNSSDKNEYKRVEIEAPKQDAQIAKSNSVN